MIMGVFCVMTVTLIYQTYRIHDETTGKMALHGSVEKARHDRLLTLEEAGEWGTGRQGMTFSFEKFQIRLDESGGDISGTASARGMEGDWSVEIQAGIFEPEAFMRKVEAGKQLGDKIGNSL